MADTTTSNYGFVKPEVGASADTWGNKVNDDLDDIDAAIKTVSDVADAAIDQVVVQRFVANGTYTPTTGMVYCVIECVGGGGGGGGADTATSGNPLAVGAGGGGGGYSYDLATAADIGASKAVSIGAAGTAGSAAPGSGGNGGDTSVGALCIAKGGTGGSLTDDSTIRAGGAGGIAGTGDLTIPGCAGGAGVFTLDQYGGNPGGNAAKGFGAGGAAVVQTDYALVSIAGTAGGNYGGGGSGGGSLADSTAIAGGAGASGLVIITEYIA